MILSFHPVIEAHQNILCAGRAPDANDLAAIRAADAVLLPQGCGPELYRLARTHCPHIFPNLDVRFAHPGKCAQIRLFRRLRIAHPPSEIHDDLTLLDSGRAAVALPAVIKLDWGGEGRTVFKAESPEALTEALARVRACEETGQKGFLVQPFIPHGKRSLRVTVIGNRYVAYWRIQPQSNGFGTCVSRGARIDPHGAPLLRQAAERIARSFCTRTGLQLAGFDFIFDQHAIEEGRIQPLLLEINYFFGRRGLGGSQAYYQMLTLEADRWLAGIGLKRPDTPR